MKVIKIKSINNMSDTFFCDLMIHRSESTRYVTSLKLTRKLKIMYSLKNYYVYKGIIKDSIYSKQLGLYLVLRIDR